MYYDDHTFQEESGDAINEFRTSIGLNLIKYGIRRCISELRPGCHKQFWSPNVATIQICPACKTDQSDCLKNDRGRIRST